MVTRISGRVEPRRVTSHGQAKNVEEPKPSTRAGGGLHDASVARSAEKIEATRGKLSDVHLEQRLNLQQAGVSLTPAGGSGNQSTGVHANRDSDDPENPSEGSSSSDPTDSPSPQVPWNSTDMGSGESTDELMAAFLALQREEQESQSEDAEQLKDAASSSNIPPAPASDGSGTSNDTGNEEPDGSGQSTAETASVIAKAITEAAARAVSAASG